jgi:hypothetical protein
MTTRPDRAGGLATDHQFQRLRKPLHGYPDAGPVHLWHGRTVERRFQVDGRARGDHRAGEGGGGGALAAWGDRHNPQRDPGRVGEAEHALRALLRRQDPEVEDRRLGLQGWRPGLHSRGRLDPKRRLGLRSSQDEGTKHGSEKEGHDGSVCRGPESTGFSDATALSGRVGRPDTAKPKKLRSTMIHFGHGFRL